MLKYIVYVVSRKSFNPLAISDKKAHRLNGNINYSEAAKLLEENTHSFGRDHFCNYCLHNAGKFSCAVDCFLELCYGVFYNHLKLHSTTRNGFLTLSMSHVIKEKTLVLLKLCEILCGYMRTFLMCWQGEFV